MQLHTQSNTFLISSGLLCVLIGSMATYLWLPPQVIDSQSIETPQSEPTEGLVNSEEYIPPVWKHLEVISLPEPSLTGSISTEEALFNRRSRREFSETSVSIANFGQMLWAGQGITNENGGRTAPSSRNLYPTRLYIVVDRVTGLQPGLYEYIPETHSVGLIRQGDMSSHWTDITPQPHPQNAAFVVLVTSNMSDLSLSKPVYQESGHVGQNFYLQAEALQLAMTVMGGFEADKAGEFLGTDGNEEVTYLVPVGNRTEI